MNLAQRIMMVKRECTPILPEDIILLLHGDGADGSTNITDSSVYGHPVTVNGNAQISTAQSVYPGGSSMYFDGSGSYIEVPESTIWVLSGDFTIELFLKSTTTNRMQVIDSFGIANSAFGWYISTSAVGYNIYPWMGAPDGNQINLRSQANVLDGNWHHIATSRESNRVRLFVDGIKRNENVHETDITFSGNLRIGYGYVHRHYTNGYVNSVRIIQNKALYTTDFTPPTAPFPTPGP